MRIFTCRCKGSITGHGSSATMRAASFPRFGYFGGQQLSTEKPLLFLVAPALHVHPATEVLLRYISPEINWVFVGIDERWREGVRVVFRKRPDVRTHHGGTRTEGTANLRLPIAN